MKITIDGVEYEGNEVDFEIVKEDWNEYRLSNGVKMRLKTSAQKMIQVVDEKGNPVLTKDGDPHVLVRHSIQVVSSK